MNIEITSKQAQLLIDTLEGSLGEIRMEIADTDSPFYKDKLREQKEEIKSLLNQLKSRKSGEI